MFMVLTSSVYLHLGFCRYRGYKYNASSKHTVAVFTYSLMFVN